MVTVLISVAIDPRPSAIKLLAWQVCAVFRMLVSHLKLLKMSIVLTMLISGIGSPFSIILEESGVTTTCNLNTYEPENPEDIPFQRGNYMTAQSGLYPSIISRRVKHFYYLSKSNSLLTRNRYDADEDNYASTLVVQRYI